MKKKICFFMNTPFSLGGEQRVTTNLANYLTKYYDVCFLLTDKNKFIDYKKYNLDSSIKISFCNNSKYSFIKEKIIQVFDPFFYKFNCFNNCIKILNIKYFNNTNKKNLIKTIKRENYDYIIGVGSNYFSMLALIKNDIGNTKIISWEHSTYKSYFETKNHRLYNQKKLIKLVFSNSYKYIVQTSSDYDNIKSKYNYEPIIISNPNTFKSYTIKNNISYNAMCAGRFDKVKNFDKIIMAFSQSIKKNPKLKLYMLGNGKELNNCKALVKKLNIEKNVEFTGEVNNITDYYKKCSIYLMASEWEGWGMVITEAMQCGLPIISFDMPVLNDIFKGLEYDYIIERDNLAEYSDAIIKLLNNEKEYINLSKKILEISKNFDIELIGKKWKEVLK